MRIAVLSLAFLSATAMSLSSQTRPAPSVDPTVTAQGPRPLPGPVYETPGFTRAVANGTRTRTGAPGPKYWVQHPRYQIAATLDPIHNRVTGRETVVYVNHAPDALDRIAVHLRQNVFAPGVPRRQPVPITGGVTLSRVSLDGRALVLEPRPAAVPITAPPEQPPQPGQYVVDGTVMWIPLGTPLKSGDSLRLEVNWSYSPAPAPADGREGHDGHVYFQGYWYPEIAVYDDVDGWVADPYLLEAELYMDHADYDARLTVPRGWVVGATGTLMNPESVLSKAARDSVAVARRTGRVVRVLTPGPGAAGAFAASGPTATWHYVANDVRDFAWGSSDQYAWDQTRALIDSGRDTVNISSYFRLTAPAAAWRVGGARYTRDAIEQMSAYLWKYPWPQMSSMEGVLDGGGMEYPMMTLMQPWADTLSLAGDLMHETGHMWFPMQAGSNETRFPWMDEGFTQFDVAQGMKVLYGAPRRGGRPNDSEEGQRAGYTRAARAGQDHSLMVPGDEFPQDLYFTMYYNKTGQILAALRGLVGNDAFHRSFVAYGREWAGKHPEPYDFFNAMSAGTGRDLSWFFTTWFYHGWPLDQGVDSVIAVGGGDSTEIVICDMGLAPMPVPLAVTRSDGTVQRVDIPVDAWWANGGSRRARIRVATLPEITRVEIDPDQLFPDVRRENNVWKR